MKNDLNSLIYNSNNIVFFGGAGVSTDSGIPDFRGSNGLMFKKELYPVEEILSHDFFYQHPDIFYKFYKENLNSLNVEPNITHLKLAELEKSGKLSAIITQNIDGLHQKAGSKKVVELHGSILNNHCPKCHRFYDASYVFNEGDVPKCECGTIIKPDVILYNEPLDDEVCNKAINYISNADLLIVAGTSLNVYPANQFLNYFKGKYLIIINKDETNYDNKADIVIHKPLKEVFKNINT